MDDLKLARARAFAVKAHGLQMYGATEPYSVHLDEVVQILKDFRVTDIDVLSAGYLHDTIEDTKVIFEELVFQFGYRVAGIVQLVTDKKHLGPYRRQRHEATYPHIQGNEDATAVKLADRIANMRRGTKNEMYIKEWGYFRNTIYLFGMSDSVTKMWHELDDIVGRKAEELVALKRRCNRITLRCGRELSRPRGMVEA